MTESNLDRQVRAVVVGWATGDEHVTVFLRRLAAVLPAEHEVSSPAKVGMRISELLAANSAEMERRRNAEEETSFWRTDALARLQMATWLHDAMIKKGDEDRAGEVRVSTIRPTLAALEAADARDFYETCPLCGDPIRPGMRVVNVAIGDPEDSSMVCAKHDEPERSYIFAHDPPEQIIAAAKAALQDEASAPL